MIVEASFVAEWVERQVPPTEDEQIPRNQPVALIELADGQVHCVTLNAILLGLRRLGLEEYLGSYIVEWEALGLVWSEWECVFSFGWASGQGGVTLVWDGSVRDWTFASERAYVGLLARVPHTRTYVIFEVASTYTYPPTNWLHVLMCEHGPRLQTYSLDNRKWDVDHSTMRALGSERSPGAKSFEVPRERGTRPDLVQLRTRESVGIFFDPRAHSLVLAGYTLHGSPVWFEVSLEELWAEGGERT